MNRNYEKVVKIFKVHNGYRDCRASLAMTTDFNLSLREA